MESIMLLLDEMEGYLQECNNLPFSSKVVVNMEVLYEFMTDLRMKLPEEIKRAKRIVDERDKMIEEAKQTAMAVDAETKEHVEQLLDDHVIRQQAIKEADELMAKAEIAAEEITDGAYHYVDDLLAQNQNVLNEMLEKSKQQSSQYEKYLQSQIDVVTKNRAAISKDE